LGALIFASAAAITHKFGLWPKTDDDIFNAMWIVPVAIAAITVVMLWWHRPPSQGMKAGVHGLNLFFERSRLVGLLVGFVLFRFAVGIAAAYGLYWAISSTNVLIAIPGGPPSGGMPENPPLAIAIAIYDIVVVDHPRLVRLVIGMTSAILLFYSLKEFWLLLVALLDRERPLEGEKALGASKRAAPEKTAAGARGSGEQKPIHTQRFQD
jgi:hypothetical protein